jgi:hypothetical protein
VHRLAGEQRGADEGEADPSSRGERTRREAAADSTSHQIVGSEGSGRGRGSSRHRFAVDRREAERTRERHQSTAWERRESERGAEAVAGLGLGFRVGGDRAVKRGGIRAALGGLVPGRPICRAGPVPAPRAG